MPDADGGRVLRTSWTPGPDVDATGTVLVAVTAFRADHAWDLPGIYRAGMRLRSAWPNLAGAVGMWLWTAPLRRQCGSVSVWRDQEALRQFVGWPDHVVIMKRYRRRGRLTSTTWATERCEPSIIWRKARAHLTVSR